MTSMRILSVFLLLFMAAATGTSCAQDPAVTDRFGVSVNNAHGSIDLYDVQSLHIGWYSDWGVNLNPPRPGNIEYVQVLQVPEGKIFPPLEELAPIINRDPGALWIVGNEPECVWQNNNTPEQYAVAYHRAYTFIKTNDPSARVAIGGVVQPTPLRLEWLDRVWDHYMRTYGVPMPVDVWNIHNMILREQRGSWGCEIPTGLAADTGRLYLVEHNDDIAIFKQHIIDFRVWMRAHGEQNKPLIITEYGILMPVEYGFTPERVNAFMNASFDYLLTARDESLGYPADDYRLVQRWIWNSLNDEPFSFETGKGFNGALFDYRYETYPGVVTPMGANFKRYTNALLGRRVEGAGKVQNRAAFRDPHVVFSYQNPLEWWWLAAQR